MVQMHKALVVYSQLKQLSMLYNVQHVVAYLEWVLERSAKLLNFISGFAINHDSLFATEMTAY
jgi:hypothetical protein